MRFFDIERIKRAETKETFIDPQVEVDSKVALEPDLTMIMNGSLEALIEENNEKRRQLRAKKQLQDLMGDRDGLEVDPKHENAIKAHVDPKEALRRLIGDRV